MSLSGGATSGLSEVPTRDDGALLWVNENVDPDLLREQGWSVFSFKGLRERFIEPASSVGTKRHSLENPAQPLLDLIQTTNALAVVGVSLRTAADLRDLYGYIVEPAFRRHATLLIASDRDIEDLDPSEFEDPVGFPWTLERLRYLTTRVRLEPGPDGLPPLTPIERQLWDAMRGLGLAPVAQYGIGALRADFAFPDARLVVECDGRAYHDPERDARRDAVLRARGWEPLHFAGSEIYRDATACARVVSQTYASRRTIVRTEQPEIEERQPDAGDGLSIWQRFWSWFHSLLRRQPSVEAAEESPPAAPTAPRERMPVWAGELDAEQAEAVLGEDGVTQVIAPAGSGKTTVLIARVRELVGRGVPPTRILCCTFNHAAADELKARLAQVGIEDVQASTFHSLGRRILDDAKMLRGKPASPSFGQWRRLAKMAMDAVEEGIWIDAPDAKDQISDIKLDRMQTVDEYAATARTPAEKTLAMLYRLYEEAQVESDHDDFDDYIFKSVRLLRQDATARAKWQREFTAVLVDEFQDIEPAQELLVQIVASPEDLLFCVGDEDQCLYAWRRASVERVVELDLVYPGLTRHALARNYRSPMSVVTASRTLIDKNHRRFPKEIVAARDDDGEILVVSAADREAQGAHAARSVKGLRRGQAVVLARTTSVLSDLAVGLAEAGVSFFGPSRIKRRSGEQGVLLAYMRLLGSPELAREEDVATVFRVPNRFLPDGAEMNVAGGLRQGLPFDQALSRLRISQAWRRPKLEEAGALFDELSSLDDASLVIHRLRTDGGLDRHYADAEQLTPSDRSSVDSLARAEDNAAGMKVAEFADALDYQATIIEQHFDPNGIELATIHGAKGRQWPLVVVGGVDEGVLPHARSLEDAEDPEGELEGERRLAYVAVTRSSERLVLMYSGREPSRFVAESALGVTSTPSGTLTVAPEQGRTSAWSSEPQQVPHHDPQISGGPMVPRERSRRGTLVAERATNDYQASPETPSARPPSTEPAISHRRSGDGSIPCSLPGCSGRVSSSYVVETPAGLIGLCPRFEAHEDLVQRDVRLEDIWVDLKVQVDEHREQRDAAVSSRPDGSIVCSLPGCSGRVRADFVFVLEGIQVGLCPQKELHSALARRSPAVDAELGRLDSERRAAWQKSLATQEKQERLIVEGGIPCSVPGCVGIVSPDYILDTDRGEEGICGLTIDHDRMAAADPFVRSELDRLFELRRSMREQWRTYDPDFKRHGHSEARSTHDDDLPF